MDTLKIPGKTGQVSDGYHTFDELYKHRCTLFIALMLANKDISWISAIHNDGQCIEGWFIAGIELPTGDISYHIPQKMWSLFDKSGVLVRDKGKLWDGHTSDDVVDRLQEWILNGLA